MTRPALVGIAILAFSVAFAIVKTRDHNASLPVPVGQYYTALAAPYSPAAGKGACGIVIGADTIGIAHPVLPCGVKIYLQYGSKHVLTQVIDRGVTAPGREFDLTQALAKLLDLKGTQQINWRFAS